ncbi:MAG: SLATT domain-containing protein [Bacteroidales bacterium]|nr:SLATT domain-containing protein [Bacteroidales bacterium]
MDENIKSIYIEIEERYVKIAWTHKIQEIQAGLYLKKSNCNKWCMAIFNGVTTTTAFVTVVTSLLESIDADWVMPVLTSVLAVISTILTLRYKDSVLDESASACKQYAAKCRNLRNKYEALLTDIMTGRFVNVEVISSKRDLMTEVENELFAGDIAPHTTEKAVAIAKKALLENGDSLTTESEIKAIVPQHLQVL